MINVSIESAVMLSLSEGLSFVWEPADLLMSWHGFHLPKWSQRGVRKILVKNLVVGQKILIIKKGLYYGAG